MSNKPAFSGNDIVSALTKKGFEEGRGDHVHLFLMVNGQRTFIRTKVSRGRKAYTDGLLKCVSS